MIEYKVKNRVEALPLENIHFGGKVAEQADMFFQERIK